MIDVIMCHSDDSDNDEICNDDACDMVDDSSEEENYMVVENYYEYEESGASGWYEDTFDEDGNLVSSRQITSD